MMPSGQFYTVVISVSDILPLDKGHYISVLWKLADLHPVMILIQIQCNTGNVVRQIKTEVLCYNFDFFEVTDGCSLLGEGQIGTQSGGHVIAVLALVLSYKVDACILAHGEFHGDVFPGRNGHAEGMIHDSRIRMDSGE